MGHPREPAPKKFDITQAELSIYFSEVSSFPTIPSCVPRLGETPIQKVAKRIVKK